MILLNYGAGEDSWESLDCKEIQQVHPKKKSVLNIPWKGWCRSWNSNTLATWGEELTHWKSPWCWERLKVGGEGDDSRWAGWMASPTQWTLVWVKSGSWWWTGGLVSMRLQRVGQDWLIDWTTAQETAPQIALRDCSKEAVGEGQYIRFWWRGSSMQWSTYFTICFPLVMRSWCHREGI